MTALKSFQGLAQEIPKQRRIVLAIERTARRECHIRISRDQRAEEDIEEEEDFGDVSLAAQPIRDDQCNQDHENEKRPDHGHFPNALRQSAMMPSSRIS